MAQQLTEALQQVTELAKHNRALRQHVASQDLYREQLMTDDVERMSHSDLATAHKLLQAAHKVIGVHVLSGGILTTAPSLKKDPSVGR